MTNASNPHLPLRTVIRGTGMFVPDHIVTNVDLSKRMDTSDEWIQQRTGIQERRHVDWENNPMGTSDMGAKAAEQAIANAGLNKDDIDCIILGTLSSDKCFPGDAVHVQAKLDIPAGVAAFDLRNQCSGFIYSLQTADALIRAGLYQNVLVIGAETHSAGLNFSNEGRDVAVIFGDGAGAVVLGPSTDTERGVLCTEVHADGRYSDVLDVAWPSCATYPRVKMNEDGSLPREAWPRMEGRLVFKHASSRMPEVVKSVLEKEQIAPDAIDLFIPHQANLRISEMVQRKLGLRDDQVFNNIQRYGNTTAGSIPIAIHEAYQEGRLKRGDLLCIAAFGAGFTWGAALIRF